MKFLFIFIFPFLRPGTEPKCGVEFATQHAMPPELAGKCGTKCLNIRLILPTLLCAGYSVKLKKVILEIIKSCGNLFITTTYFQNVVRLLFLF